jgi:hypothetical protein
VTPDPTSLDRLHDLVLPPPVPWWPVAPGWYVVLLAVLVLVVVLAYPVRTRWRADAYRRAALRELATLRDAPAIAALLRRTALAVVPRSVVAGTTGTAWADWLAARCPGAMSDDVRQTLTAGIYDRPATVREVGALHDYAARWIARHHLVASDTPRSA